MWGQQEQLWGALQGTAALQCWLSGMCATVVHAHLLWHVAAVQCLPLLHRDVLAPSLLAICMAHCTPL